MTLDFPQSLTEKYRPRKLDDFIGLAKPKKVLSAFAARPFASAWLFLGPSGVGKTSMALALAQAIPAELQHIPSRACDLESVEAACRHCWYVPMAANFHLVLVDEADQMTPAAQLAFLSKLDATASPPNTIFIFTANDTRLLEQRFLSRCRTLDFGQENLNGELTAFLRRLAKSEGGKLSGLTLERIAKECTSNVRDAVTRLEVQLMTGEETPAAVASDDLHPHRCPKCSAQWEHDAGDCAAPFKTPCRNCDPAERPLTVGQARARKAWRTIRKNVRAEILGDGRRQHKTNS